MACLRATLGLRPWDLPQISERGLEVPGAQAGIRKPPDPELYSPIEAAGSLYVRVLKVFATYLTGYIRPAGWQKVACAPHQCTEIVLAMRKP